MSVRYKRLHSELLKKFKGSLRNPIIVRPLPPIEGLWGLGTPSSKKNYEYEVYVRQEYVNFIHTAKFNALFKLYNIDANTADKWHQLCIKLAQDCVPGFSVKVESSKLNKNGWTYEKQARLFSDVLDKIKEDVKAKRAISIRRICINLKMKEPWLSDKASAKRLSNRFHKMKKDSALYDWTIKNLKNLK